MNSTQKPVMSVRYQKMRPCLSAIALACRSATAHPPIVVPAGTNSMLMTVTSIIPTIDPTAKTAHWSTFRKRNQSLHRLSERSVTMKTFPCADSVTGVPVADGIYPTVAPMAKPLSRIQFVMYAFDTPPRPE